LIDNVKLRTQTYTWRDAKVNHEQG